MATGLPYVSSSTENLTLSDHRCMNDSCRAFYDAHQLSQKLYSYAHQFDYGHYVSWYLIVFLGIFSLIYFWRRWNEYRYRHDSTILEPVPHSPKDKLVGLWRMLAYRRVPGWISNRFGLPSIGLLIVFLAFILYNCILTFAVRPYYREHRGYGSPPLAVRTGLMATALTPWIIALSGKANLIALLTGIGHEKLNIMHRWISWLTFGLSVVHTVPFIVAPLKDGGYTALHKQFYKPGGYEYTGTPPLAIFFGILIFSVPWIRHRLYEGFYHLHFLLGVTYVGLMFWHCDDQRDSWGYMWATVVVWIMTMVARAVWYTRPANIMHSPWFLGSPIIATSFPDNMTRLQVLAPDDFHWTPGQHIYLRIPQLAVFDNHPFTIAGIDTSPFHGNEQQTIPLFLRSYAGFTRRLRSHLAALPDSRLEAWVEGPYGGHHRDLGSAFDDVILVAGGGGISAILPWLEYFVFAMRSKRRLMTARVKLVWSIRHREAILWIIDGLERLDLKSLSSKVQVVVHVTGGEVDLKGRQLEKSQDTKRAATSDGASGDDDENVGMVLRNGRIDLNRLFDTVAERSRCIVIGESLPPPRLWRCFCLFSFACSPPPS